MNKNEMLERSNRRLIALREMLKKLKSNDS